MTPPPAMEHRRRFCTAFADALDAAGESPCALRMVRPWSPAVAGPWVAWRGPAGQVLHALVVRARIPARYRVEGEHPERILLNAPGLFQRSAPAGTKLGRAPWTMQVHCLAGELEDLGTWLGGYAVGRTWPGRKPLGVPPVAMDGPPLGCPPLWTRAAAGSLVLLRAPIRPLKEDPSCRL